MKKNILLSIMVWVAMASCKKEAQPSMSYETNGEGINENKNSNKIDVSNLAELYTAVNDVANAGKTIELAPGTYILSSAYPNGGRLELQEDMILSGKNGHPEVVIIDASALPGTSFVPAGNFPAPRTGAIRVGRGRNAILWLTVKGNASQQALSVIDTDLIWPGEADVLIAHSVVTGGRIGVDLRNPGTAGIGRHLNAVLFDNEVKENLIEFGQGVEVQNANGASHASINAVLKQNYFHNNKIALRGFNNNANNTRTDSSEINIQSTSDRFEENGYAVYMIAGLNQGANTTANHNKLYFEAHGTKIINNQGTLPPEPTPASAVFAVGGYVSNTGTTSFNLLEMHFWGCTFANNYAPDIIVIGASSRTAQIAGVQNTANVYLNGISANAVTSVTPSIPVEPAQTNTANVY